MNEIKYLTIIYWLRFEGTREDFTFTKSAGFGPAEAQPDCIRQMAAGRSGNDFLFSSVPSRRAEDSAGPSPRPL